MKKILIALALLLVLAGVALATTSLTNTSTWCTTVQVPDPGERVSAGTGTGGIRTALQCLANRTYSLMRGTTSLRQLQIDGVGATSVGTLPDALTVVGTSNFTGNAVVAGDLSTSTGNITANGNFISTGVSSAVAAPTATVAEGTLPIDNIPLARGFVQTNCGGVQHAINVQGAALTDTGTSCSITLNNAPAYAGGMGANWYPVVTITPQGPGGAGGTPPAVIPTFQATITGGKGVVKVWLTDSGGTVVAPVPFSFIVWP